MVLLQSNSNSGSWSRSGSGSWSWSWSWSWSGSWSRSRSWSRSFCQGFATFAKENASVSVEILRQIPDSENRGLLIFPHALAFKVKNPLELSFQEPNIGKRKTQEVPDGTFGLHLGTFEAQINNSQKAILAWSLIGEEILLVWGKGKQIELESTQFENNNI